jgi:hypothetical protein
MAAARQHLLSKSIKALKLTKIHYPAGNSYTVPPVIARNAPRKKTE